LRSGESIAIKRQAGDIVELRKKLPQGATLVLAGNSKDGYTGEIQKAKLIEKERTVNGTVISTFATAALDMDLPYALVDDFVDLFSNRVEFRKDISTGDTFSVKFTEERSVDGSYVAPGIITAASIKLGDKFFAAVRDIGPDGTVQLL